MLPVIYYVVNNYLNVFKYNAGTEILIFLLMYLMCNEFSYYSTEFLELNAQITKKNLLEIFEIIVHLYQMFKLLFLAK